MPFIATSEILFPVAFRVTFLFLDIVFPKPIAIIKYDLALCNLTVCEPRFGGFTGTIRDQQSPTNPFTNLGLQNPSHDVPELHKFVNLLISRL